MAEALTKIIAGDQFDSFSAGTEVTKVKPWTKQVLEEIGVEMDPAIYYSKSLTEFLDDDLDYVVTVCDSAKESCPIFPKAIKQFHWEFSDPSDTPEERRLDAFRETREKIKAFLELELPKII